MIAPPGIPTPLSVPFPDVRELIESSRPRGTLRVIRPGYVLIFLVAAVVIALLPLEPPARIALELMLWGVFLGSMVYFWNVVRGYRNELSELDQIEDLLALKRHPELSPRLQAVMSQPMRTDQNRLRAMVLLASVLGRLQRYDDALLVYNELVDAERLAGPGGAMVKLGRAMAMLHSDHLYDADRAINDLRRLIDRGGAESEAQQFDASLPAGGPDAGATGALRIVELYRDVKTGHAEEAIALFEQNIGTLRKGLGHRVGEAYAMAAVAYDRVGREDDARQAFADATTLQGVGDLLNRYAELRPLIAKYTPTRAPNP